MLKVYGWNVCPHTLNAVAWLKSRNIPFEYLEIEEQPEEVVRKVVEVNGGDDWVVPTLEFNGRWHPGERFDPAKFERTLKKLGVI